MNKFKSKKGFTLAELLIVVAIIAVLVAIAVPLFVGALNQAREARDDANLRAVKSAAVASILLNEDRAVYDYNFVGGKENTETANPASMWTVKAYVSSTGEIKKMIIDAVSAAGGVKDDVVELTATTVSTHSSTYSDAKAGDYYVTLVLNALDLKSAHGTVSA